MKLFKGDIEPACMYCELGSQGDEEDVIICSKFGEMDIAYSCKKFKYAPLKRIPHKTPLIPSYTMKDFEL